MELIKAQVTDEFPRTRLEAVRALSFVQTPEAVETALLAVNYPLDYWLEYTLQMTVGALEPVWKGPFEAGKMAQNNPRGREFLDTMAVGSKPGEAAEKIIKRLLAGGVAEPDRRSAYDSLGRLHGSANNGKAIFNRICVACHRIDGQGVDYGPDLSKVAGRLSTQDIVESIMDPNAKVDPKYTTTNVDTKDGETYTGFAISETDGALTLRIAGGKDVTLKTTEIGRRENLKVSSMPEGLAAGMSATEFLDVVSYLAERK